MYKINGNPEEFADLGVFHKLSQQFLPFAHERLEFDKPVSINLISDPQNAKNPLGKTAYYNPGTMEVTVFIDNRHVKDILRSMAHELVHHTQNCRGEFEGGTHTGPGYAQEDGHMRKMEEEAYLKGQMTLRDFEDNLKENKTMSKKRLKERVVNQLDPDDPGYTGKFNVDYGDPKEPAIDFGTPKLGAEEFRVLMAKEGFTPEEIAKVFSMLTTDPPSPAQQAVADMFSDSKEEYAAAMGADEEPGSMGSMVSRGTGRPEPMQEGEGALCEDCGGIHEGACMEENLQEGWSNKKDQLLFERLVNKWIK